MCFVALGPPAHVICQPVGLVIAGLVALMVAVMVLLLFYSRLSLTTV